MRALSTRRCTSEEWSLRHRFPNQLSWPRWHWGWEGCFCIASVAPGHHDEHEAALEPVGTVKSQSRFSDRLSLPRAHQMLSGVWQVVAVTDNGDSIGPELIRRKVVQNGKVSIGNRVITHVNPETGETRTTGYIINPLKSPKQIDLITPEERILPGIYKFEGRGKGTSLILTASAPSAKLRECHEPLDRSKQGWSTTSSIVETDACACFTRRATTTPSSDYWERDSSVTRWIC